MKNVHFQTVKLRLELFWLAIKKMDFFVRWMTIEIPLYKNWSTGQRSDILSEHTVAQRVGQLGFFGGYADDGVNVAFRLMVLFWKVENFKGALKMSEIALQQCTKYKNKSTIFIEAHILYCRLVLLQADARHYPASLKSLIINPIRACFNELICLIAIVSDLSKCELREIQMFTIRFVQYVDNNTDHRYHIQMSGIGLEIVAYATMGVFILPIL